MALNDYLSMMKDFRKLSLNGLQHKVESGCLQGGPRLKDCMRDCWTQRRALTERRHDRTSELPITKQVSHERSVLSTLSKTSVSDQEDPQWSTSYDTLGRNDLIVTQRHLTAKKLADSYVLEERRRCDTKFLKDSKVAST